VQLTYYPNGQVKDVRYSSAPDGGIQRYSKDCVYDAQGLVLQCSEEKYPYELFIEPVQEPQLTPVPKPAETIECAAPALSVYEVVNTTRMKIQLSLSAKPHLMVPRKSQELVLGKRESAQIDSVLMANLFFPLTDLYTVTGSPARGKSKIRMIHDQEIISDTRRVYRVYIVRE
jgi:hypothetical protein